MSVCERKEGATIKNSTKFLVFTLVAVAIVVTDQITKHVISTEIQLNSGTEVIPGLLNLVHVRNPGAAFGFLSQSSWDLRPVFFISVSCVALVVILWLVATTDEPDAFLIAGYSLFFGGTLGNLIDRIRFGEVIDFLDVHIGTAHWPAFNVADSALCLGATCFFIHIFRTGFRGN